MHIWSRSPQIQRNPPREVHRVEEGGATGTRAPFRPDTTRKITGLAGQRQEFRNRIFHKFISGHYP